MPFMHFLLLTLTALRANSADNKVVIFFLFFPENRILFHANFLHRSQFVWNIRFFLSGKNILKCCMVKILPRVLFSVKLLDII